MSHGGFMKKCSLLILIIIAIATEIYSQGVFTMSTNKMNYNYGEIIEVKVSIYNNTDSTLIFHPECGYPIRVRVKAKGIYIKEYASLADGCERWLKKGEKETWTFQINPAMLGFPFHDGEQTIYGSGYNHRDSLKVAAPRYKGGTIEVAFNYINEKAKRDKLYSDLNASLIKSDTIKNVQKATELWSIKGKNIDSLVNALNNVWYFNNSLDTYRWYDTGIRTVTSISNNESLPDKFMLSNNYPNPFNPETVISYQLAAGSHVLLKVFDVLGREITTLVNEFKSPGTYSVVFNTGHLERSREMTSGIYFYRLQAVSTFPGPGEVYSETKKMMLVK